MVEFWQWCIEQNIWVSAAHLPGVLNVEADYESPHFRDNLKWKLDKRVFRKICRNWFRVDIDLFASRLNAQIPKYVSWKPDPFASFIDTFSLD